MATAAQLPGEINIVLCRADDYSTLIDLSIDCTGYTWAASIYSLVNGTVLLSPTITVVDAAAGKFNISLSDAQAAALPPGTLGLRIDWLANGVSSRRAFQGVCEVVR